MVMSSWVNVFVFKHLYWGIIAQHKNHLPWLYNFMNFSLLRSYTNVTISSVQSLSRVWLFATPWIAARQASLSITDSRSSLRLTSIESVMPSSHLILCRPLLLLPPIPPDAKDLVEYDMVGLTEKELGNGLVEKLVNLVRIAKALRKKKGW